MRRKSSLGAGFGSAVNARRAGFVSTIAPNRFILKEISPVSTSIFLDNNIVSHKITNDIWALRRLPDITRKEILMATKKKAKAKPKAKAKKKKK
ncbi:MAG: hypothetical protein HY580_05600 [Nitrospinae bacterium]|nr:hypothetical protein [Nitrospinota bacterium]